MATSFAALIYRADQVSERALSHGFGVSLAGYDLKAPSLLCSDIPGQSRWKAAFYRSGRSTKDPAAAYEEFDHACELFEDELPPGRCVCDAAEAPEAVVYALVHSDDMLQDDGFRFTKSGFSRSFVHEVDDGAECGYQDVEKYDVEHIPLEEDDSKAEVRIRPYRGSVFLSKELGFSVLSSLVQALFMADRKLLIRLLEGSPAAISEEAGRLNAVLGRTGGRGAFALSDAIYGVKPPDTFAAFVQSYDWSDPRDPSDLYRELALGGIEGTLHFMRGPDIEAKGRDSQWEKSAKQGLFPFATLKPGGPSGQRTGEQILSLSANGESLSLVDASGRAQEAGPTFAELLRYLALGWKKRDEVEEDLIEALMLKAKVRRLA